MKLIKSSFEILEQPTGEEGMYKQIEKVGRVCWKSENKITEDSYKKFIEMLKNKQHFSVLEHGTVYLHICNDYWSLVEKYTNNKYSKVKSVLHGTHDPNCYGDDFDAFITTNYRVLVENDWLEDLKYLCEPTKYHEKRITVKFTMDRIGSQSFCRHRVFSFAQESTRYCNYSKDKFGNELTFIIPSWLDLKAGSYSIDDVEEPYDRCLIIDRCTNEEEAAFVRSLCYTEKEYLHLIQLGWTSQQARQVLTNALKTELVMTGFVSDWKHFFKLRDDKDHAHPDAYILAHPLHEEFIKRNLI
jgi:thymidylate synthase (FAD)|nr:MAG TPA: Thymidylate synthase complementing protein [Crassvirales sp.]